MAPRWTNEEMDRLLELTDVGKSREDIENTMEKEGYPRRGWQATKTKVEMMRREGITRQSLQANNVLISLKKSNEARLTYFYLGFPKPYKRGRWGISHQTLVNATNRFLRLSHPRAGQIGSPHLGDSTTPAVSPSHQSKVNVPQTQNSPDAATPEKEPQTQEDHSEPAPLTEGAETQDTHCGSTSGVEPEPQSQDAHDETSISNGLQCKMLMTSLRSQTQMTCKLYDGEHEALPQEEEQLEDDHSGVSTTEDANSDVSVTEDNEAASTPLRPQRNYLAAHNNWNKKRVNHLCEQEERRSKRVKEWDGTLLVNKVNLKETRYRIRGLELELNEFDQKEKQLKQELQNLEQDRQTVGQELRGLDQAEDMINEGIKDLSGRIDEEKAMEKRERAEKQILEEQIAVYERNKAAFE
ncbi:uncharacterized protein K452DRAFT_341121 [Aplosporella prunicola CBS 121167]|uniref:Uncharacterized protein n=1 Tax=Aplosporella prunicola CBS 121167 TaxID=1176127 RepID=A0A6A6B3S5_9PEZI|nr:uncharacterized protein K452DRAFT_341121 [Aplosporella prunicola CBS 121167]KAF2137381.1 hypothetical protein K452DRAFT_341121 [Aplosporella prunicola CBS 121167]